MIFLIYGYACFILDRMQPCHLPTLEIMMPLMVFLMRLSLQSMLGVLLIIYNDKFLWIVDEIVNLGCVLIEKSINLCVR
jgi:hypothetical protein